ncbi:MAG: ribosome maturation factor RimM [Elusimicrobiota bacterium]
MEEKKIYLVKDLDGCEVITTTGENLGKLRDVLPTKSNDIYVVIGEGEKEILIPALRSVVLSIDIERKRIEVDLPDGLKNPLG